MVKRQKLDESAFLFFWKPQDEEGWLSNWSAHAVMEDGIKFRTTEHYLMYRKAMLMRDVDAAGKILVAKSPSMAKTLGRSVKNWDEALWVAEREGIMFRALVLKCKQHPTLKKKLADTGDKIIVEASPYDGIWGIGVGKENPKAVDPSRWLGKNLLGEAWMRARAEFT